MHCQHQFIYYLPSLHQPITPSFLPFTYRNSRVNGESADAGDNDGGDYFGVPIIPNMTLKKGGGGELGMMTPEDPNYDLTNARYFDLVLCDNVMPNMDGILQLAFFFLHHLRFSN